MLVRGALGGLTWQVIISMSLTPVLGELAALVGDKFEEMERLENSDKKADEFQARSESSLEETAAKSGEVWP